MDRQIKFPSSSLSSLPSVRKTEGKKTKRSIAATELALHNVPEVIL